MITRQPRALLLGFSLILAACGGEGLTLPPDGAAANIEVMSGNGQSGRVGSTLAESLVVKVTDTQDRPVAGAEVVFEFTADGSTASPATVSTDANGIAWSRLGLGTRVGPVGGTVRVPVGAGVTPVQATISATALAANANGITLVSGNDQSGAVGTALSGPLVVAVADEFGNPIPNVTIEWSVAGGGSVSPTTTLTGSDGQASVTRTLGPTAGEQTTLATAVGLVGSPVTFTHTATAGSATGVIKVSGDNQSALVGTELADPLVVQVLDAQSNPIPNRAVTWVTGDGSVSPENATTDAQGHASTRWTLGSTPGAKTARAVVSGLETATFNATATAGAPSASASSVSASPGTITAGTGTSTISVTVRDAGNNPLSGVSVTAASSGSGNTISPVPAFTGTNGVATFTFSSTVAESKTITATAGGVAITDQATITVQKVSSNTQITSDPDAVSVFATITVEFTVAGAGGTPTGQVTVTVSGGTETCTATLTAGSGSCDITFLVPGTGGNNSRVVTASYGGDARFNSSSDSDNQRVDPLPTANNPPTAAFTPPICTAGQSCQFNDGSSDGDGSVEAWSWNFGPGGTSNDQNPTATFPAAGTFPVTLTVTDDDGAPNSVTKDVTVSAAPNASPTAAFSAPTTCTAGTPCPFDGSPSSDPEGPIASWSWDFGDPLPTDDVSNLQTPSYTYGAPGTYTVTLTVTDGSGTPNTVSHDVIIP